MKRTRKVSVKANKNNAIAVLRDQILRDKISSVDIGAKDNWYSSENSTVRKGGIKVEALLENKGNLEVEHYTPFVMLWAKNVPAETFYGHNSVFSEAVGNPRIFPDDSDSDGSETSPPGQIETSYTYTF